MLCALRQRCASANVGFRELLDALPAAVYTTDAAGRITYYNEAAATLSGTSPFARFERVVRIMETVLARRNAATA